MKRVRQVLVILIAVGVGCWLAWRAWGPHPEDRTVLSGYIESETLNLSAPVSGFIARLDVARGDRVAAGQALFAMDDASLCAQRDQAAANLAQAQAQIAVAQAKLAQSRSSAAAAQAQAVNAAEDLKRYRSALRVNAETVSRQQVDTAVATAANAAGQADAARGDVAAQESQIASAKAQSAAQQAALADIAARLAQLTPQAPAGARVQDVFYQKGEWAADNQPVVSLLPDDKVKLRFFVPETQVTRYRPGETVHFDCDGCAPGLTARISYVSAQPEYTPPIIYSRNTRDRLVFLVEALPADGRNLPPGLPVDVTPLP
ncbi:MAG TPA: HlyD family efflux transporter periplasmic adaptor subunit [Acetobacteraceae bacterium]|jgi:HlyD family secretion protein|nr:HlyD family efflux transporter periplasmic adaptor subunit [Acetobacteraceae bacterium]